MDAKIIEQGNGFRGIAVGSVLVDADGDIVTVAKLSTNIHTDDTRGNYLLATVESGGDMSDEAVAEQSVIVRYVE